MKRLLILCSIFFIILGCEKKDEEVSVVLVPNSVTLIPGDSKTISVSVFPEGTNISIVWTSDDSKIATVTNGTIRGINAGETMIYAGTQEDPRMASCYVKVKQPINNLSFENDTIFVVESLSGINNLMIEPINAEDAAITWSSDNPSVLSVDDNGTVLANAVGLAKITARSEAWDKSASFIAISLPLEPRLLKYKNSIGKCTILSPGNAVLYHDFRFETDTSGWYYVIHRNELTEIDKDYFANNTIYMTAIAFPPKLKAIRGDSFFSLMMIEDITLGESIEFLGEDAFRICPIKSATILCNIPVLPAGTFDGSHIEKVIIGEKIKNLDYACFWQCDSLKEIKFLSKDPVGFVKGGFSSSFGNEHFSIYVPEGSAQAYRNAGWYNCDSIIEY